MRGSILGDSEVEIDNFKQEVRGSPLKNHWLADLSSLCCTPWKGLCLLLPVSTGERFLGMKLTKRKLDTHLLNCLPALLFYQTPGQSSGMCVGGWGQTRTCLFFFSLSTYNW